jgi:hypothetical protein
VALTAPLFLDMFKEHKRMKDCVFINSHVTVTKTRFGLVNWVIGSSLVITTNNCNTFKITVIITHMLSLYGSSIHFSLKHSGLVFTGL